MALATAVEELRAWWDMVWHQDRMQREFVATTLRAAIDRVVSRPGESGRRRR
jgi:hypothetical protein